MTAAGWDVLKDGLGFFGAVLAAVPWSLDFFGRDKLRAVGRAKGARPSDEELLRQTQEDAAAYLMGPFRRDFLLQSLGLLLIAGSFAISALKGLGHLGVG